MRHYCWIQQGALISLAVQGCDGAEEPSAPTLTSARRTIDELKLLQLLALMHFWGLIERLLLLSDHFSQVQRLECC